MRLAVVARAAMALGVLGVLTCVGAVAWKAQSVRAAREAADAKWQAAQDRAGEMLRIDDGAYWIDVVEVTTAEYQRCVDAGACTQAGAGGQCNAGRAERNGDPANCVDNAQAQAFCAWTGRRLPTAWEWERAACGSPSEHRKASEARQSLVTDCYGRDAVTSKVGLSQVVSPPKGTCAVRAYPQSISPAGMLGVDGNVAEWTKTAADGFFVTMGGNWADSRPAQDVCKANVPLHPAYRDDMTGFRCARSEPKTLRVDLENAFF